MERKQVISSNINSIGYDANTGTLEIEFVKDRSIYQYYSVPQAIYRGLMAASSHGTYLSSEIKDKYSCKKLT
jgi:hypothetical protein